MREYPNYSLKILIREVFMNKYKRLSLGKDEKGSRIFQDEHRYVIEKLIDILVLQMELLEI